MASIADVYITILPETSKIAPAIKKALKEAGSYKVPLEPDTDQAKKDTERWRQEESKKPVKPPVKADTVDAEAELKRFRLNEERKKIRQKIEFDESNLRGQLSTLGKEFDGVGAKFASALKWNTGLVGVGLLPSLATSITNVAGALQQLAGAGFAVPGIFAGLASSVGTAALGMAGMKDAIDAVNKAADGTQASVDAANAALAGLSPNAADAVKTIVGLKGTFEDLRNIASQNLFAGFSDGLKGLISESLPEVTNGINQISHGLNQNLLQVMKSLGSDSSQGFLDRIFGNTGEAQHRLTAAIDPIIHAVGLLSATGSDVLPRLADAIGKVADRFDAFITKSAGNGNLTKWINDGLTGFTDLGNTLLNIGKSFTALTQAAGGDGGLLKSLRELTENMSTFLNSAEGQSKLSDFFEKGRDQLGQLRDIAKELGPVLGGVFNAGLSAANLWLPVIREVLRIINSIPGGAQAVVTAFVAWKTIQGPVALASAIANIANLLKVTLPNAAASGAAAASSSLGRIASALGPIAALVGSVMAITGGKPLDYITGDKSPMNAANQKDWAKVLYGDWAGGKLNDLLGTGPQAAAPPFVAPTPGWDQPGAGGLPGAQRDRRGAPPIPSGWMAAQTPTTWQGLPTVSMPAPPVAVPGVSSYAPPIVTDPGSGGGSSSSGTPYDAASDPYLAALNGGGGGAYGLPAGTNTGGYGTGTSATFPPWVMALGQAFGVTPSTYGGHQETDRNEAGYAPNPGHENRGIDWSGPIANMQKFADYLKTIPQDLEQVIWNGGGIGSGDTVEIAGGRPQPGYFAGDLAGHGNHVHTRQSGPIPLPGMSPLSGAYPAMGGYSGDYGPASDKSLRDAQQKIDDKAQAERQAQLALDELPGDATQKQREAAEYSLIKAKREHADALTDLTTAQDKYNKSASQAPGAKGGSGENLGQDIVKGMMDVFGLGDLFKDPTQFGLFKLFKGAMGLKFADDGQGGSAAGGGGGGIFDGLLGGGGGGGGLGGILSSLPQAFGNLNVGGPQEGPGQFIPGMNGIPGSPAGGMVSTKQGPGAAGTAGSYVNDFRGANFGHDPKAVQNQVNSAGLQHMRQPLRNLPVH